MAHIRTISHCITGDFASARAIVHTHVAPFPIASSSRICLPYRDVHKFQHDGSNDGVIPKMLWKMLQELGYERQSKYYGTQVTYEGSEPVWHVQVHIFYRKLHREVFEVKKMNATIAPRCTFYAGIHDAAHQAYMVTHSHHHQLLDGTEYAHFPQCASGSTYIHGEPVPDPRNFKLKKQVKLTTALTKELDSTMEEVEFWQEKHEVAMSSIEKLKHHCPRDLATFSYEEIEEFTLASHPRKMATCAPPIYVIPHNDDD
jgi:hypothetical protein